MASWRLTAMASANLYKLRAALIPVPAIDAGAKNSRSQVFGFPGTVRIPAPAPFPGKDRETVALSQGGWIGLPSSNFQWWTPSLYWVPATERAPVSRISDNQMPVPASDPRGLPGWGGGGLGSARNVREARVMPGPIMLGQTQVANPRLVPKYLDIKQARR